MGWELLYRIRRWISHTHTPGAVSQARLLDKQEGANAERCVFRKLSAACFERLPCWYRHYPNHGDIEHGKIGPGYPWCDRQRRIRVLQPLILSELHHVQLLGDRESSNILRSTNYLPRYNISAAARSRGSIGWQERPKLVVFIASGFFFNTPAYG